MSKVAGIRFHSQDKVYHFDQKDLKLNLGDVVIVETELGTEAGEVVSRDQKIDEKNLEKPLKPVLRTATSSDLEKIKKYQDKVSEALTTCHKAIEKYKLPMKLIDAHFAFDGSRLTFYFTAESRIDFRNLVKDLTRHFQKSVRLQQIGSRDAAAKIGGCGICGCELCCARFLNKFESITIDMARSQQMAHRGSERLSGVCGRLMCCLSYETKTYQELVKKMPVVGQEVKTSQGVGRVISRNVLKQEVEVELDKENRSMFDVAEIKWKK
jgi:cell fate regulator YaaT (PSP1 superfamily)